MAKLGMMHTLLRHVSHPLQQHHEDVLPRHNSPGKQNGASHMDESDRNLVNNQMFTSSGYHKNHPYDDDNGETGLVGSIGLLPPSYNCPEHWGRLNPCLVAEQTRTRRHTWPESCVWTKRAGTTSQSERRAHACLGLPSSSLHPCLSPAVLTGKGEHQQRLWVHAGGRRACPTRSRCW